MNWQPIERFDVDHPIWVIKYDIFFYSDDHPRRGNFCSADTPGAQKFTDCHGWYEDEETARKVLNHFPKPNSYSIEKVYKRILK